MTFLEIQFDLVIVFFVYGLAFFCMGLVLMLEARRYPRLAEARVLWPLAIFGFVHGAHEWLEMAILIGGWFELGVPSIIPWVRLGMLVVSFTSDWLYPTYQSRNMVKAMKKNGLDVSFCEIEAKCGHDAFLLPNKRQSALISKFLERVYEEDNNAL